MKKMMIVLTALLTMAVSANAMSYAQAREQALFLTDKMAYELNLNDAQYEAAYEINLDYLMGIDNYDDLYGVYWNRRNLDLSYVLLDWQYRAYCAANYFYRPLYWDGGYWHFAIYARYPHRDYFYFGRPNFIFVYNGGHSWHHNGNRSWYHGRDFAHNHGPHEARPLGMRDRFDRGDYGRGTREFGGRTNQPVRNNVGGQGNRGNQSFGGRTNTSTRTVNDAPNRSVTRTPNSDHRSFGTRSGSGSMRSSTRTTVERRSTDQGSSSFGGRTGSSSLSRGNASAPTRTFTPNRSSHESSAPSRSYIPSTRSSSPSGSGSFGGRSMGSSGSRSIGSSSSTRSGGGSFGGGHR